MVCLVCSCGRLGFDPTAGSASGDDGGSSAPDGPDAMGDCDLPGLIMYLSFDEGSGLFVMDRSSGGHNAALFGLPTWTTGRFGGGMAFNGDNNELSSIEMPTSLDNLQARTACLWQTTIDVNESFAAYFDKAAVDGDSEGWNLYGSSNGRAGFFVNTRAFREVGGNSLGAWHHVCGTWDGMLTEVGIHIYVDGVEPPTLAASEGGPYQADASHELKIGNSDMNRQFPFHGTLDEVRLYNRALSATEVAALTACSP